jgi:hypothetical protein
MTGSRCSWAEMIHEGKALILFVNQDSSLPHIGAERWKKKLK